MIIIEIFFCINKLNYNYNKYNKVMAATSNESLKNFVWQKYYENSMVGYCVCCYNIIGKNEFECEHIVPLSYGGLTTVDNLRVICVACYYIRNRINNYLDKHTKS